MREDAAQTLWADDYESLRERARAHLGAEAAARPAGASRNVRVVSSRLAADREVATVTRPRELESSQFPASEGFARAEPEPRRLASPEPRPRRFARTEPAPERRRFATAEPQPRRVARAEPEPRRLTGTEARPTRVPAPRSYGSRRGQAEVRVEPAPRRTVTITGQASTSRRRSPALARVAAEPDRTALWAVMLGIFLALIAVATAHASPPSPAHGHAAASAHVAPLSQR